MNMTEQIATAWLQLDALLTQIRSAGEAAHEAGDTAQQHKLEHVYTDVLAARNLLTNAIADLEGEQQ